MIFLAPLVEINGQFDPATNLDGNLVALTAPGMTAPVCDRELLRFVVVAPEGFPAPDDWEEMTKEQINDLYPGTF